MAYNSAICEVIQRAVKTGRLVKSDQCEICGSGGRIVAHHWNGYDDPLDIWWICARCNNNMKGSKFHSGLLSLNQAKRFLLTLYQYTMKNINNLSPQQLEVFEFVANKSNTVTSHDIARYFDISLEHAGTILLVLRKADLLKRRHVDAGRQSYYEYWPGDGEEM